MGWRAFSKTVLDPKLNNFVRAWLQGLRFVSSSAGIKFLQLKSLEIRDCGNMVDIISTKEYDGEEKISNMFPMLQVLKLEALANLEQFCTTASYIEFSCLKMLLLKDCMKVETFINDRMRKNIRDIADHSLFNEKVDY